MKIVIFNPYKNQSVAAEGSMDYAYEQIKSIDGIDLTIKASCNTEEIVEFAPDFIIAHYNFTPKFCHIPTYITFNGPTSFKFKSDYDIRYCLSFDGYLTQSESIAQSLEDLCFGYSKKCHVLKNFANSRPKNDYFEVNLKNPKLAYFANNWEVKTGGFDGTKTPRFEKLFSHLAKKTNFLELYGDAKGWSWIENNTLIKGAIPFENADSLNNAYRNSGVGLALSTHDFHKEGAGNNRIYEIVSSGAVCIADDLPFYKEVFGNNLLYITTRDEVQMAAQIIKHFNWIKNNPQAALEKAKAAHEIFCQKLSMEKMVQNVIAFHHKVQKENYCSVGYKNDLPKSQKPLVSVVVRSGDRSAKMVARTLDSVANQTYDNIQLVFILYKENQELADLIENYRTKFSNLITTVASSNVRSTVMYEGIKKTNGDYVAILDDDDIWYPNHLSKMMEFFDDNPNAEFVYAGRVYHNESGTFPKKKIFHELGGATNDDLLLDLKYTTKTESSYCMGGFSWTNPSELLSLNHPIHPCFLVKKSVLSGRVLTDPKMHHAEDLYFCALLYKLGYKFFWMPELTMQMNIHGANSAHDQDSERESIASRMRMRLRIHGSPTIPLNKDSENYLLNLALEKLNLGKEYQSKILKLELKIRNKIHRIRNKYIRNNMLRKKISKILRKLFTGNKSNF